ncbi:hypothetical protein [Hwangdonia seohaensis]|uniref:DUF4249 family protein n=1 Tax=Hwangdonia seohaensis TaxID=1240727 RepID=A0ABW3R9K8_9FLAO|nr:hypothetical protein [Hwangdonia seohaensis]
MNKFFTIPLLFFFLNCQDNIQKERLKGTLDFEPELTQQFFVAPNSIIQIQGKKGTKIIFKIEDLEGILSGPNIKDSLLVNLIELTTKQDLLNANTQTVSNEKWLISGGAFKIEILVKNSSESLTLKKGKTISVQFPKSSNENNMIIFYGARDKDDNMNWEETDINLEEKKFYSLFYTSQSFIDTISSSLYGVDMYYNEIDTLGYLSLSEYKYIYPKIDSLYVVNDTLSNLKSWKTYEDMLANISQSQLMYNSFYNSIETSKLGWINIDKFAPNEEKIKIKLELSTDLDAIQTYIIDKKNNTVLNVENNEVEIPVNRSFFIISFGLVDDVFYASKKSVRFNESKTHTIEFKKLKNSQQMKSFLKLK